jgi:LytS/YehU family sensor histidine kinase
VVPLLAIVVYFGTDIALNIGSVVCGTDHYEVGQWHLLAIIVNFITLVVATIFGILLMLYRRIASNLEKKIQENTELSRMQLETKFALLQSKVNPHFLFNTLNTMLDVLRNEPKKVENMILNLSDIYRKTLTLPDRSLVSVDEELELVREYLEIEKIRMGERLEYRFHIKEHLRQTKIPPMMVQILVENAIRHGLTPKKEGGSVDIKVDEVAEDKIVVEVEDTGVGIEQKPSHSGYGLTCIKQQLKLLYDSRAMMHISLVPTGGTHVSVELPLH